MLFADFACCIQAKYARFFIVNLLQGAFNLGAIVRTAPTQFFRHFVDVVFTDIGQVRFVNLHALKK
ncbi:MAG TPA: hypothetical protein PKX07_12860 [Aggregatilineales bacterium]|nr:hypothetical protein [Aggregatilineales bacterium]